MKRLGWLAVLVMGCGGDDGLPPAVSILAPQDGAVLTGGSVDLVALVSDSDDELDFSDDDELEDDEPDASFDRLYPGSDLRA